MAQTLAYAVKTIASERAARGGQQRAMIWNSKCRSIRCGAGPVDSADFSPSVQIIEATAQRRNSSAHRMSVFGASSTRCAELHVRCQNPVWQAERFIATQEGVRGG
jgi:hypothetical protein